jgi:hypothetical protein
MAYFLAFRLLSSFPFPLDVARELGMGQQLLHRIEVPAQFLFIGDQVVDRLVARLAEVHPLLHLLPCVSLLKPLVSVQGSRDEVVEVVDFFGATEFAKHGRRRKSSSVMNRQPKRLLVRVSPGNPVSRMGRDVKVGALPQFYRLRITLELYGGTAFQDNDHLVLLLVVPESRRGSMTLGNDPLNPKIVGLKDRGE